MDMASSRSPDINYNASGYLDLTARDAIIKADRMLSRKRKKQLEDKLHKIAHENGFFISGKFTLVEIEEGDE